MYKRSHELGRGALGRLFQIDLIIFCLIVTISVKVPISEARNTRDTSHAINFCLLNNRSVKNKPSVLKDFVVGKDIDLFALTDTWLRPGNIDCVEIGDLCPTGYDFIHIPRESRGGGVALLLKESLDNK